MGNRGVLHDDARRIVRPWQLRRWIACVTGFRGRHREVMQPRRYTELFFLDEATALSAGHRPCAECRSADYKRFRDLWISVRGEPANADSMDRVLHTERLDGKQKRTYRAQIATLPDGTYVVVGDVAHLLWHQQLYAWSDSGYGKPRPLRPPGEIDVLTPPSIVALLRAGLPVSVHPTAG